MTRLSRRWILAGGAAAAGAAALGPLVALGRRFSIVPPDAHGAYGPGTTLNYAAHRLLNRHSLAREFPREAISAKPFANEIPPHGERFLRHQAEGFANWRLAVRGRLARPLHLSIPELRAMPSSTQVTEIACEEGWSYVAEWTGTPLASVLTAAGVQPSARFVVYYSMDEGWWDAIDIDEAMHPQTLIAWGMNGGDLPVPFGGPLRLRVPRQLGYKSVKFVDRMLVTESMDGIPVEANAYAWWAGI